MVDVTCKIDNKSSDNPAKIVISSVAHGVGRIEVNIGAAHAEVDGKELIQAVQNCRNNCFRRYLPYNRIIQNAMEEGV